MASLILTLKPIIFRFYSPVKCILAAARRNRARQPACFDDIESVRTNCSDDSRYERKKTVDNKHYFVLMGPNGEIIGKSELFSSLARMENGIKSVKKNGTNRKVVEEEPYF